MPRIDWEVSGQVQVENWLLFRGDGAANLAPLSGVTVEVAASTRYDGGWRRWGRTKTDGEGRFQLPPKRKSDKRRRFRVRVFLEDDRLRVVKLKVDGKFGVAPIVAHKDTAPYTSRSFRSGPLVELPSAVIREGATRATRNHARRANIWYVLKTVQDALREQDPWLAYLKKLTAVYPTTATTWAAGNSANIGPGYYKVGTVIHEAIHVWDYQHNTGMTNWVCAWLIGGTHGRREPPSVAFHEGFASWASRQLLHDLWGHGQYKPFNKKHLDDEHDIRSLSELERNDDGVMSVLRLLTHEDPYGLLLGTLIEAPTNDEWAGKMRRTDRKRLVCPKGPILDTWDLFSAFRANRAAGWRTNLQVGKDRYGVLRFIERLSDFYPDRFGDNVKEALLNVVDPIRTDEMSSLCRRARRAK